ncbi:MAG: hypothetical protein Q4A75_09580 [Peptostreptococcaceae bacterium]|nr:hypothetical protein [Peptostreptococcaceae bacterium]
MKCWKLFRKIALQVYSQVRERGKNAKAFWILGLIHFTSDTVQELNISNTCSKLKKMTCDHTIAQTDFF